jgi:hypothetical protein
MSVLDDILNELEERLLAERVTIRHDEARMRYPLKSIIVANANEMLREAGNYYAYHYAAVVAPGAQFSPAEAEGKAKALIEGELRRTGKTILNAVADAKGGQNSGMAGIFNLMSDGLRDESLENYIESVFTKYVDMESWVARESVMHEFLTRYGHILPPAMANQPAARYASEWKQRIREFVEFRQRIASSFRRV